MNLTIGFITFFISIIIPGILFRRFYFYGEFSKQFNTKDPVLHTMFLSIVPGIILQLLAFIIYQKTLGYDSNYSDVFTVFKDLTSDNAESIKGVTKVFFDNDISTFFYYSFILFLFSGLFGYLTSRLIRVLQWDKKYKVFRFKNQWYYIFSGEVLNFKKFKDAHRVSFDRNQEFKHDISTTFADVLIKIDDERKELYSGYVVDYDLSNDNVSKLDKIYLLDAYRYKKAPSTNNYFTDTSFSNTTRGNQTQTPSRNQKQIPGDVFIVDASNIVNINLTYVPSLRKEEEKKEKQQKKYTYINNSYLVIIVSLVLFHFLYGLFNIEDTKVGKYMIHASFWQKGLMILFINQVLSWAVPNEKNENGELFYSTKQLILRVIATFALGLAVYKVVL